MVSSRQRVSWTGNTQGSIRHNVSFLLIFFVVFAFLPRLRLFLQSLSLVVSFIVSYMPLYTFGSHGSSATILSAYNRHSTNPKRSVYAS